MSPAPINPEDAWVNHRDVLWPELAATPKEPTMIQPHTSTTINALIEYLEKMRTAHGGNTAVRMLIPIDADDMIHVTADIEALAYGYADDELGLTENESAVEQDREGAACGDEPIWTEPAAVILYGFVDPEHGKKLLASWKTR